MSIRTRVVRSLGRWNAGLVAAVTVTFLCPLGALPALWLYLAGGVRHTPLRSDIAILVCLGVFIVIFLAWSNRFISRRST